MTDPTNTLTEIKIALKNIEDTLGNINDILLDILEKKDRRQCKENQSREEWLTKSGFYNE